MVDNPTQRDLIITRVMQLERRLPAGLTRPDKENVSFALRMAQTLYGESQAPGKRTPFVLSRA